MAAHEVKAVRPAAGDGGSTVAADALASVVVFLVALPLCMGVAIASGMQPTAGIITGIIGGIIVGAIAGSPLQVSGPAAGLSVLVLQLIQQHGLGKLALMILLAGIIQIAAGVFKLGQWFRAVSPAVIHGMLAGIGVLILVSQFHVMMDNAPLGTGLQNLFGMPGALIDTLKSGGTHLQALGLGILTIATIVAWSTLAPKQLRMVPAPLVGVVVAMIAAAVLKLTGIKYVEVPASIWSVTQLPTMDSLKHLVEPAVLIGAVSIAFIASAETLLCATAVDQMHSGPRTKYDQELLAQGVGNTLCGALAVLPMTGVIVRSGANVEAGAKTRLSAMLHGVWLLLFASLLPFTLRYIPMSALAAILVYTGYKLAYPKVLPELRRYGKTKVAIYYATIIAIVATNLLTGVLIGLGLSLAKLLHAVSHLVIHTQRQEGSNRIDVSLVGSATLIRLPQLASELESLPAGAEIHVHTEYLDYIDHACLDLLTNWDKQHRATGGSLVVEWHELSQKYHQRRAGAFAAAQRNAAATKVETATKAEGGGKVAAS